MAGLSEGKGAGREVYHLIHSRAGWGCLRSGPRWRRPPYLPEPTWPYWAALRHTPTKINNDIYIAMNGACVVMSLNLKLPMGNHYNPIIHKRLNAGLYLRKRFRSCPRAQVVWGSQRRDPTRPRPPMNNRKSRDQSLSHKNRIT